MRTYLVNHNFRAGGLSPSKALQIYNGLDCCITSEVFEKTERSLDKNAQLMYDYSRGMQAPVLEVMRRGIKVNLHYRDAEVTRLENVRDRVERNLNKIAFAVWGKNLNPRSVPQVKEFLYERLGLPKQYKNYKGTRKVSTDINSLEKLRNYFWAQTIVNHILKIRDLGKLIGTLKTQVDPDGRMRTSYNIGGTETWRFSSSSNAFGRGTNKQNLTDEVRRIFVADEGKKFAYIDLDQAESFCTGVLAYLASGQRNYFDACSSGDLHTTVTKLVWPQLPWTGDLKQDKEIAETVFYRHFTYRFMSKKGGHGSNYYGKPYTISMHMHVEPHVVEAFQAAYFESFPELPVWHQNVAMRLQSTGCIETPLGNKRRFWGRLDSDDTLKEAIAFGPQSMVALILNLGMYRVWKYCQGLVEIMAQVHDALLIQYDEKLEDEALEATQHYMKVEVPVKDLVLNIPNSVEGVGWNWGKAKVDKNGKIVGNHDGILSRSKDRGRVRTKEASSIMDRVFL